MRWLEKDAGIWEAENFYKIAQKAGQDQAAKEMAPSLFKNLWSARANLRHTDAPMLMDNVVANRTGFLQEYLGRFGDSIRRYEEATGRAFTVKEQILAHAKLEKLDINPHYTEDPLFRGFPKDKAFNKLVEEWRQHYDAMWDFLFEDPKNRQAIIQTLNAATPGEFSVQRFLPGSGTIIHIKPSQATKEELMAAMKDHFQKLPDYVPHYPAKNLVEHIQRMEDEIKSVLMLPREQIENAAAFQAIKQVMSSAYKRRGARLPHLDDLELVKEYLNPEAYTELKGKYAEAAKSVLEGKPAIIPFTMRLMDSTATYVHEAGSMYAFAIKGDGRKLIQTMLDEKAAGRIFSYKMLQDTFIPSLMGLQSYKQALVNHEWSSRLAAYSDWVGSQKWLPKFAKDKIQNWMIDKHGLPNILPIQRSLASWFYYGALGLNPAASARNLFQLSLTTAPVLGAKYTAVGVERAMKKAGTYFELRLGGVARNEAFARAFPEYVKAGIPASPAIESTVQRTLESAWDHTARDGFALKGSKTKERLQDALMSLFSGSESTVRMVTFEGAMAKGLDDSMAGLAELKKSGKVKGKLPTKDQIHQAVSNFARETVMETQFVNAASNIPYWLMDKGPLTRQFLQFASRMGEWYTNTSWAVGGGVPSGRTVPGLERLFGGLEKRGLNPGTFARTMLWSEMIGRGALEAFGVNMDQSLLFGALPMPREYGPFAPVPFLPPAYGLVGGVALDLAKGDTNMTETKRAAPLLIPGGIALAKLGGYSPVGGKEVANILGRQYVDWNRPTPDGRYPLYTGKGSLIGYMTAGQLFLSGTGIAERGPAFQTEQDLYRFLLSNRDRIREYKQDYMRKIISNDIPGAQAVDKEFQQAVPGVGAMEKWVSEEDIQNAEDAMDVTRLEKLLDTMPKEVRPYYAEALQAALYAHGDPYMLGLGPKPPINQGTRRSRRPGGRSQYQPPAPNYQNMMSPLSSQRMQPQSISQGPYSLQQPFGSFQSLGLGAEQY